MNKLRINLWLCVLSVAMCTVLFQGCEDRYRYVEGNPYDMSSFGFLESEQVVEVDDDTKSFRIVGKWTEGDMAGELPRWPWVYLDTKNTTAVHKEHYINHVDPKNNTVGAFTPLDSNVLYRERVVQLLPENIKDEKVVHYIIGGVNIHNQIYKHRVILRPKAENKI